MPCLKPKQSSVAFSRKKARHQKVFVQEQKLASVPGLGGQSVCHWLVSLGQLRNVMDCNVCLSLCASRGFLQDGQLRQIPRAQGSVSPVNQTSVHPTLLSPSDSSSPHWKIGYVPTTHSWEGQGQTTPGRGCRGHDASLTA